MYWKFKNWKKSSKVTPTTRMKKTPQIKGTITKMYTASPKKPNSANRKVCKVKSSRGFFFLSAVKGVRNNLKKFSKVWVEGFGFKDTPLISTKVIPGKDSFLVLATLSKRRSRFGLKKN